ncbi:MAG: hypothetical protein WCD89_26525 [Anaerocolumna sp.]
MFGKISQKNKSYITTIISLLICAMFLSYYNINYSVGVLKNTAESSSRAEKVINSETYARTNGNRNKFKFVNSKLADTEKEEILSEKALADTHYDSSVKKWMICYLYIFNILLISSFLLYIKGWFIKVSHSRYQFYQVHYIQLKDGKKDALSYCQSI